MSLLEEARATVKSLSKHSKSAKERANLTAKLSADNEVLVQEVARLRQEVADSSGSVEFLRRLLSSRLPHGPPTPSGPTSPGAKQLDAVDEDGRMPVTNGDAVPQPPKDALQVVKLMYLRRTLQSRRVHILRTALFRFATFAAARHREEQWRRWTLRRCVLRLQRRNLAGAFAVLQEAVRASVAPAESSKTSVIARLLQLHRAKENQTVAKRFAQWKAVVWAMNHAAAASTTAQKALEAGNARISALDAELIALKTTNEALEQSLQAAKEAEATKDADLQGLRETLSRQETEMEALKESKRSSHEANEARIAALQQTVDAAKKAAEAMEERYESAQKHWETSMQQIKSQLSAATSESEAAAGDVTSIERELKAARIEATAKDTELNILKDKLAEKGKELEEAASNARAKEEELTSIVSNLREQMAEKSKAEAAASEAQKAAELAKLEAEKALEEERRSLAARNEAFEALQQGYDAVKQRLEASEKELIEAKAKAAAFGEAKESQATVIAELTSAHDLTINRLQQQLTTAAQGANSSAVVQQLKESNEGALQELKEEFGLLRSSMAELKAANDALSKEKEESAALRVTVEDLEAKLAEQRQRAEKMEEVKQQTSKLLRQSQAGAIMLSLLKKLHVTSMHSAMAQWRMFATDHQRQQQQRMLAGAYALLGVRNRRQTTRLYASFVTWRDFTDSKAFVQRVLNGVNERLRLLQLSKCWDAWYGLLERKDQAPEQNIDPRNAPLTLIPPPPSLDVASAFNDHPTEQDGALSPPPPPPLPRTGTPRRHSTDSPKALLRRSSSAGDSNNGASANLSSPLHSPLANGYSMAAVPEADSAEMEEDRSSQWLHPAGGSHDVAAPPSSASTLVSESATANPPAQARRPPPPPPPGASTAAPQRKGKNLHLNLSGIGPARSASISGPPTQSNFSPADVTPFGRRRSSTTTFDSRDDSGALGLAGDLPARPHTARASTHRTSLSVLSTEKSDLSRRLSRMQFIAQVAGAHSEEDGSDENLEEEGSVEGGSASYTASGNAEKGADAAAKQSALARRKALSSLMGVEEGSDETETEGTDEDIEEDSGYDEALAGQGGTASAGARRSMVPYMPVATAPSAPNSERRSRRNGSVVFTPPDLSAPAATASVTPPQGMRGRRRSSSATKKAPRPSALPLGMSFFSSDAHEPAHFLTPRNRRMLTREEEERQGELITRVVRNLTLRTMIDGFQRWKLLLGDTDAWYRERVTPLHRVAVRAFTVTASRYVQRLSREALHRWRRAALAPQQVRQMQRLLTRRAVGPYFAAWVHHCHRLRLLSRVSATVLHLSLAKGWRQWVAVREQENRVRDIMVKALRRIQYNSLYGALRSWRLFVQRRRDFDALAATHNAALEAQRAAIGHAQSQRLALLMLNRMLSGIAVGAVASSFRHWRLWSSAAAAAANAHGSARSKALRRVQQLLAAWHKDSVAGAWEVWRRFTATVNRRRGFAIAALQRLSNRHCAMAMASWKDYVQFHRKASKVCIVVERQPLARALRTWKYRLAWQNAATAALSAIASSHKRQQLRLALQQWRASTVKENASQRHRMEQITQRLMHMVLLRMARLFTASSQHRKAAAFATWRGCLDTVNAARSTEMAALCSSVAADAVAVAAGKVTAVERSNRNLRRAIATLSQKKLAAAWHSWRSFIREDREMELQRRSERHTAKAVALTSLLHHLQRHRRLVCGLSLAQWRDVVASLRESQAVARKVLLRLLHGKRLLAWERWVTFHRNQALLRRVAIRFQQLSLAKSFNAMKQNRADRRFLRHVLQRCMAVRTGGNVHLAWNLWREYIRYLSMYSEQAKLHSEVERLRAEQRRQRLETVERTVNRLVLREQHAGFSTWKTYTRAHFILQRAVAQMRQLPVLRSLNAWSEYVARRRRAREVVEELFTSRGKYLLRAGFRQWRDALETMARESLESEHLAAQRALQEQLEAAQAAHRDAILQRAGKVLTNASYRYRRMAFATWCEYTRRHRVLQRAVAQMRQLPVLRSLNAWSEYVARRRRAREVVEELFTSRGKYLLRAGFRQWRDALETMARESLESEHLAAQRALQEQLEAAQAAHRDAILQRAGKVLTNASYRYRRMAFATWCEYTRRHRVLQRAVAQMRQLPVLRSLNVWSEYVARRRRARAVVEELFTSRGKYLLRAGFRQWRNALETMARESLESEHLAAQRALQEQLEAAQAAHRDAILQRAGKVLTNASYRYRRMAFATWCEYTRRHRVLQRAVAQMRQLPVLRSLNAWSEYVARRRRAREVVEELFTSRGKYLLRAGFRQWRDALETMARESLESEHLAAQRALQEQLEAAQAAHRDAILQRAGKVLTNASYRYRRMAFATWCEYTRRHRVLQRAVAQMRQLPVLRSLNAWSEYVARRRRARAVVEELFTSRGKYLLRAGFRQWRDALETMARESLESEHLAAQRALQEQLEAAQAAHRDAILQRAGKVLTNASYRYRRMAFATWCEYTRRHRVLQRAVAQMRQLPVLRSLNAWSEYVDHRRRARNVMQRCTQRLKYCKAWAALSKWKAFVATTDRQRSLMEKFATRLVYGHCALALQQWKHFTASKQSQQRRIMSLLVNAKVRALRAAFRSWGDYLDTQSMVRHRMAKLILLWRRPALRGAFGQWRSANGAKERQRLALPLLLRAIGRVLHSQLAAGFNQWRNSHDAQAAQQLAVRRVVATLRSRSLATAWTTWKWRTQEQWRQQHLLRRLLARLQYSQTAAGFEAWRQGTWAAVHQEGGCMKLQRLWRRRTLRRGWSTWIAATASHRNEELRRQLNESMGAKGLRLLCRRLAAVQRRFDTAAVHTFFEHWRAKATSMTAFAQAMGRLNVSFVHHSLRSSFRRWHSVTSIHQRQSVALTTAITALMRFNQRRCFKQWTRATVAEQVAETRRAVLLRSTAARWRRCLLLKGWTAWKTETQQASTETHRRSLLRRIVAAMAARHLHRGFATWRRFHWNGTMAAARRSAELQIAHSTASLAAVRAAEEHRRAAQGAKLLRLQLLRWQRRMEAAAFRQWQTAAAQRQWTESLVASKQRRHAALLQRRVWGTWTAAVAQSKRRRQLALRGLSRWRHALLSRVWGSFEALLADKRRKQALLQRCIARLAFQESHFMLRRGLSQWQRYCASSNGASTSCLIQCYHYPYAHMTVAPSLGAAEAMMLRVKTLTAMHSQAQQRQGTLVMARVLGALQQRRLAMGWRQWRSHCIDASFARRVAVKWRKWRLRTAFQQLRAHAAMQESVETVLRRVVGVVHNRVAAMAMHSWAAAAAHKAAGEQTLHRCAVLLQRCQLRVALRQWRGLAMVQRDEAVALRFRTQQLTLQSTAVKRIAGALQSYRRRLQSAAMLRWRFHRLFASQRQSTLRRFLLRRSVSAQAAAFQQLRRRCFLPKVAELLGAASVAAAQRHALAKWQRCASTAALQRQRLHRALQRLRHGALARGFTAFTKGVFVAEREALHNSIGDTVAAATADAQRHHFMTIMSHALTSLSSYSLRMKSAAFHHWCRNSQRQQLVETAAAAFGAKTLRLRLRSAMMEWRRRVAAAKQQRLTVQRRRSAAQRRQLKAAFTAWQRLRQLRCHRHKALALALSSFHRRRGVVAMASAWLALERNRMEGRHYEYADRVMAEFQETLTTLEHRDAELQRSETTIETLKKELAEAQGSLEEAKATADGATKEGSTATAALQQLRKTHAELQTTHDASVEQVEALRNEIERLREDAAAKLKAMAGIDPQDVFKLKKGLSLMVSRLKATQSRLQDERSAREISERHKEELEQCLREAKDRILSLDYDLSVARAKYAERETVLEEMMAKMQSGSSAVMKLSQQAGAYSASLAALREQLAKKEGIVKDQERRIRELTEAVAALKGTVKEKEWAIAEAEELNAYLNRQKFWRTMKVVTELDVPELLEDE